jgi:hypothetical protein
MSLLNVENFHAVANSNRAIDSNGLGRFLVASEGSFRISLVGNTKQSERKPSPPFSIRQGNGVVALNPDEEWRTTMELKAMVSPTYSRLYEIATSHEGWRDPSEPPLNESAVRQITALLGLLPEFQLLELRLYPTDQGGIKAQRRMPGKTLSLTADGNTFLAEVMDLDLDVVRSWAMLDLRSAAALLFPGK